MAQKKQKPPEGGLAPRAEARGQWFDYAPSAPSVKWRRATSTIGWMFERVRGFYQHFGFEGSPTGDLQLMLLMKDIRKSLGLA